VSVDYRNSILPVVKTGNFEFDTDLLISLVKARPVLWDKTDDIYKDRNETKRKRHGQKFVFVFKENSKISEMLKKTLFFLVVP